MQPKNLAEVIQYIAKQEQEKLANQIAEAQQKLITASYDKAASYTTVIIFGGYAGIFAIWQLTKDHLSKEQALCSALLVLISLVSFVAFELVKMIMVSKSIFRKVAILNTPEVRTDPQRLLTALNELEAAQHASLGLFQKFWGLIVIVSIGCALGATGILGYAFIMSLAR